MVRNTHTRKTQQHSQHHYRLSFLQWIQIHITIGEYKYLRTTKQQAQPNPRLQFLKDIKQSIRKFQDSGNMILLMLDANGVIASDTKLREMIEWLQLHDLDSNDPAPSTYIGSSNRQIDYMFGCSKTKASMIHSGTLSCIEGPQSDHRGLYADVDLMMLLCHNANDATMQHPALRTLKSGNPEVVATYQACMLQYYDHHNMVQRINHLHDHHLAMTDDEVRLGLERWDRDQGRAMSHSENILDVRAEKITGHLRCATQEYYAGTGGSGWRQETEMTTVTPTNGFYR